MGDENKKPRMTNQELDDYVLNSITDDIDFKQKKFFFQKRRGKVDLRAISKIDIDRVVKEVDIDTLQAFLENVTFGDLHEEDLRFLTDPLIIKLFKISQMTIEYLLFSQEQLATDLQKASEKYMEKRKRILSKRKEVIELQEANRHLKAEVKQKKKNLDTLQELLKEAARTKGTENRARLRRFHEAGNEDNNAIDPSDQQSQPSVDDVLRFFVSFADGLCFEFTKKAGSKVWELRSDVKKAFLNRRSSEIAGCSTDEGKTEITVAAIDAIKDIDIKLRGISLQDDKTLMDSRIDSGDTLTAHLPERRDHAADEAIKHQQEASLRDLIAKQQEAMKAMSEDIQQGLSNAMSTITTAKDSEPIKLDDADLKYDIDSRLTKFEDRVKSQLEWYQEELKRFTEANKAITSNQYAIKPGDIESDDEVNQDQRAYELQKINELEKKLNSKDNSNKDLRNMIQRLEMELEDMKAQMNEKSNAPPPLAVTTAAPLVDELKAEKKSSPKAKKSSSAKKSPPPTPVSVDIPKEEVTQSVDLSPVPDDKVEIMEIHAPEPEPEPEPEPAVVPPPTEKIPMEVTATFSEKYNAQLSKFDTKEISVRLNTADSIDELVFELRKRISEALHVHIVTIYLLMESGEKVMHGVDLNIPLSAVELKELVDSGKLTLGILTDRPINDAQVEYLADEVEEEKTKPTWNNSLRDSKEYLSTSGYVKKNMNPDTLSDARTDKGVNKLRASLDSMMEDVILNNEDGLTNEELKKHLASLDRDSADLDEKWSKHMEDVRENVSGTINLAFTNDQEFLGADDITNFGDSTLEPKTLKLLTGSEAGGNPANAGRSRYQLADSLESTQSYKNNLAVTGETAVSDYDYGDDAFEDETSGADLDMTTKTVESDFTLTKSEEKSSMGGGSKKIEQRDVAVKQKADEYEKAAKLNSPLPREESGEKDDTTPSIQKAKSSSTPVAARHVTADSTYSKSSSVSNLSPFGTLAENDIAADTVQEFDLQEQSFSSNTNTNPADGSLALSESNDLSFVSM